MKSKRYQKLPKDTKNLPSEKFEKVENSKLKERERERDRSTGNVANRCTHTLRCMF